MLNEISNKNKKYLIAVAVLIIILMIFSSMLSKVKNILPANKVIRIRGVAEQIIDSDMVNWAVVSSYQNNNLDEAYQKVDTAISYARKYLISKGVPEKSIKLSTYSKEVKTKTKFLDSIGNTEEKFMGYVVSRSLIIKGFENLDLVELLNDEIPTESEKSKLKFYSDKPYFYYSKRVDAIKPKLLEKASENAYKRGKILAESMGASIGDLSAAKQGAFNGFGDDGFGSGGFIGGETRKHVLNAQVSAEFLIK